MDRMTLRGSCLCGAVSYEASGEPVRFYHCHCRRCRKATGTGHATNLMLQSARVSWLQGEDMLLGYKVPDAQRFRTCFCRQCGSPMPRVVQESGIAVILAGSLDTEPGMAPQARIFWDSRSSWSCAAGDLPVFAEYPPRA